MIDYNVDYHIDYNIVNECRNIRKTCAIDSWLGPAPVPAVGCWAGHLFIFRGGLALRGNREADLASWRHSAEMSKSAKTMGWRDTGPSRQPPGKYMVMSPYGDQIQSIFLKINVRTNV